MKPNLVMVAVTLVAMLTGACQHQEPPAGTSITPADQAIIDEARAMPLVSALNGKVPPGTATLVDTSIEELNLIRDGQQVRVFRDMREAGTRSPIHVHPFGGWSCVVSGQAVLYVEGQTPQSAGPGECVEMPALVPMSNVNPGPGPSILLDSFVTPQGAPIWRIVERGLTHLGNEFSSGDHTKTNPQ